MEAPPGPSLHQHVTLPTLASLVRLLPICLLFFLTTPHGLAEHIHAFYTRRPYTKPPSRDAYAAKRGDIDLSELPISLNTSFRREQIILVPGTSLYASLRAPALCTPKSPCSVLIETWYESDLPRDVKPDPYLLAANGIVPQPFPHDPSTRLADDEAFHTWRTYHYIQILSISIEDDWHFRIRNHDATVFNQLNATLRVSISPVNKLLCPKAPNHDNICSSRGSCDDKGNCKCKSNYGGRYCETLIEPVPIGNFDVPPDGMRVFKYQAPRQAHIVTFLRLVPPQRIDTAACPILFAKRFGENGGKLLSHGPPLPTIYDASFTDAMAVRTRLSTQQVVSRNVSKGDIVYIAVYNFRTVTTPGWIMRRQPHSRSPSMFHQRRSVSVFLSVYPCVDDDIEVKGNSKYIVRKCPSRTGVWEHSMGMLFGPLLLGSLTLMTMVVCVSVWAGVFRQHMMEAMGVSIGPTDMGRNGFLTNGGPSGTNGADGSGNAGGINDSFVIGMNHNRDKLSPEEVDAMFPAFQFSKGVTEALSAVGDASCSVCLCAFEEGEALRRLPCGHSYHSICLDRWLITNASCPRCRKKARIHGDVLGRSRLLARVTAVRSIIGNVVGIISSAIRVTLGGIGSAGNRGNTATSPASAASRAERSPERETNNINPELGTV